LRGEKMPSLIEDQPGAVRVPFVSTQSVGSATLLRDRRDLVYTRWSTTGNAQTANIRS